MKRAEVEVQARKDREVLLHSVSEQRGKSVPMDWQWTWTCDCQRFYSMARKIISIAMHGEVVIIIDNNKQECGTATHNHNVYISRWGKIILRTINGRGDLQHVTSTNRGGDAWWRTYNIEQQLESRRGGVILTKQSIPYGCRTDRSLNLEHATINCRFGWHIEMLIRDTNETITNDLLSRVEVRTGTKQINHEVSIRKNNGVWTTELRVDKTDTT